MEADRVIQVHKGLVLFIWALMVVPVARADEAPLPKAKDPQLAAACAAMRKLVNGFFVAKDDDLVHAEAEITVERVGLHWTNRGFLSVGTWRLKSSPARAALEAVLPKPLDEYRPEYTLSAERENVASAYRSMFARDTDDVEKDPFQPSAKHRDKAMVKVRDAYFAVMTFLLNFEKQERPLGGGREIFSVRGKNLYKEGSWIVIDPKTGQTTTEEEQAAEQLVADRDAGLGLLGLKSTRQ